MNWSRWSRWCFLGALVMLVWMLVPAGQCTLKTMDETPLSELEEDDLEAEDTDTARVEQSGGFLDRFFGSVGRCYDQHPIAAQDDWKQKAGGGLAAGWLVFWIIGFITKPRYTAG